MNRNIQDILKMPSVQFLTQLRVWGQDLRGLGKQEVPACVSIQTLSQTRKCYVKSVTINNKVCILEDYYPWS